MPETLTVPELDNQVAYWDGAASSKTLTHPLHRPWLNGLDRDAAILARKPVWWPHVTVCGETCARGPG